MAQTIEDRIYTLLEASQAPEGADDLLAEGYARALKLDAERLTLERNITALAARADHEEAAHELRRAWLRHRTINAELRQLRTLLRRLKDQSAL